MANVGTAAAGKTLIGAGVGSSPTYANIGTNSGLTSLGVVIAQGNNAFQVTSAGTTGQVLMGNTGSNPSFQSGGSTFATTYIADSGSATPSSGIINMLGQQAGTIPVMDTIGSLSTLSIEDRTWTTQYVVDPSSTAGLRGTFTTIQAAITAASSGTIIFIRPGTYTENLTLKNGITLTSYPVGGSNSNSPVIILGKAIDNGVGLNFVFCGIQLKTNSDYVVSLTAASSISLVNCNVNANNNTALNMTNASANIYLYSCIGNVATTAISLYSMTTGDLWIYNSQVSNTGNTVTGPTQSGGIVTIYDSEINIPLANTSASQLSIYRSIIDTNTTNTIAITTAGSGSSHKIEFCEILSGSASAISVGSGTTVSCYNTIVNSSNTNAITGAGTINYGAVTFSGSSSTINTTTKGPIAWPVLQGGTGLTSTTTNQLLYSSGTNTIAGLATANSGVLITSSGGVPSISSTLPSAVQGNITSAGAVTLTSVNFGGSTLSSYALGTWTPTLIGGSVAGTTTYVQQVGSYVKIGGMVTINAHIQISAATGTGDLTIGGIPYNPYSNTSGTSGVYWDGGASWTWPAGRTNISTYWTGSSLRILASGSGVSVSPVQMANASLEISFTMSFASF